MNTAYIYRLKTKEGLIYIGSHLVRKNKTIYTDNYCGSSQDPRLKNSIVSKEILCFIKGDCRKAVYNKIQLLEHKLILSLNCINRKEYANASSQGVIGINYKRLGAIASNKKQREDPNYLAKRSEIGKSGAEAVKHIRTKEWYRKGQLVSAKSKRQGWNEGLYNSVKEVYTNYPNKKAYAIWTYLKKPTKTYKSIFHILKNIKLGYSWEDIC